MQPRTPRHLKQKTMAAGNPPLALPASHSGADDHAFHHIHPWERLKKLLRAESTDLWIAVVYSGAIGLISLVLPVATQSLVNTVAFGTLLQPLVVLTALVLIALCFNTVMNAYRLWVVEVIQRRIFVRIAGDVTMRLVKVKPEALDKEHAPELVNRFLDVVTVQKAAATLLVDGLSVIFQTVVGMALLAIYHPWLLAFDLFLLVAIFIVLFPLGAGAIPSSIRESAAKFDLVAWLEEIARYPHSFKNPSGAALAVEKTNSLLKEYLEHRGTHFRVLLRQICGSFTLQAIASAVLLGVGGWLVIDRQLTLGQLVAAEIVVALVINGFTKFGKHLESFYDMMAAMDKLGYLSDLPVERETGEELPRRPTGAHVRLKGVTVGYSDGGPVLQNVDCELPSGARIGLIGTTGSGKSTLLDVIHGYRTPLSGYVEIDGLDTRSLRLADLRSQVALVRVPEIFEGTIFENLRVADPALDTARARQVLEQVGLLEVVLRFGEGLETMLSTGGRPLSPGQRVQFEIARALLREPRVLILDECMDKLDDLPDRARLLDTLFSPDSRWTLVVASLSPEVLGRCGVLYELRDGKLHVLRA